MRELKGLTVENDVVTSKTIAACAYSTGATGLFGGNTLLTHGPRAGQTAANGFEALADLDMDANGVSDGQFDANDVAYASVQLWKDLNQDGISQANELFSFAQLGVQSITVGATAGNVNLANSSGQATGNTQTFSGSFTKTDGSSGDSGTAHLAGSLLLANNNFYRQFTDDPAITAQAAALPQMQGSGLAKKTTSDTCLIPHCNNQRLESRQCHIRC